ncbi:MAG: TolC family protein [Chitinophagales bacterium]|nr:TolC family protein [Chitinophagales bacterium]MCZ2394784.1 TolC family protein [Chitinophagales bacterium]
MNFKNYLLGLISISCLNVQAQEVFPENASLQQCIDYALKNQASIHIAEIDEQIAEKDIAASLSGWLPQVGMASNYNHNLKIPSTIIGNQVILMGMKNVSSLSFQADQQILNPQLIKASKSAKYIRELNTKVTEQNKINTVVEVSKAYYDILTSNEQLEIIQANILRIEKQLSDATSRFEAGLVDQTDYKRAKIALSNSKADLKRTEEMLKFKYVYLKELIGLDAANEISLSFEQEGIDQDILENTPSDLNISNRVEYQILETQQRLQQLSTKFAKVSYMPSMSAFINYGLDWRANKIGDLYNITTPRSVFGLNFSFNIFDGNKKLQYLRKSQLLESRLDWSVTQLKNQINTQYKLAISAYQANINDWTTAKENMQMSQDVYDIIKLQYDAGIKNYLELMTADTDLKTAQINYLSALFAVLSSKLDVQKALGEINISTKQ